MSETQSEKDFMIAIGVKGDSATATVEGCEVNLEPESSSFELQDESQLRVDDKHDGISKQM